MKITVRFIAGVKQRLAPITFSTLFLFTPTRPAQFLIPPAVFHKISFQSRKTPKNIRSILSNAAAYSHTLTHTHLHSLFAHKLRFRVLHPKMLRTKICIEYRMLKKFAIKSLNLRASDACTYQSWTHTETHTSVEEKKFTHHR